MCLATISLDFRQGIILFIFLFAKPWIGVVKLPPHKTFVK
jgi:hypothetical protein